jgi:hypothetical protein
MRRLIAIVLGALVFAGIVQSAVADGRDGAGNSDKADKPEKHDCSNHGVRFTDNGDGTVTDCSTGLMWEKKTGTCTAADPTDPHCYLNTYTPAAADPPHSSHNGTLYTDFLARLNDDASADAVTTCFANHCDWRIPNIHELQTILSAPYPCPIPCINPIFGPIALGPIFNQDFWSSTELPIEPVISYTPWEWLVRFSDGQVLKLIKGYPRAARAVRGGQ